MEPLRVTSSNTKLFEQASIILDIWGGLSYSNLKFKSLTPYGWFYKNLGARRYQDKEGKNLLLMLVRYGLNLQLQQGVSSKAYIVSIQNTN